MSSLYSFLVCANQILGAKSWTLRLQAIDHGWPSRFTQGNITLTLNDYNEFPPVFQQPSYQGGLDLSTTIPAGTHLLTVLAKDFDGRDHIITYSITEGIRLEEFLVDAKTGSLTVGSYPITQVCT